MWFSHHVQGYTVPGEQGQLSGGIYQGTQFNLQLLAHSTLSKLVTSSSQHLWYHHSLPPLLKSTIPQEREREARGELCLFTPTPPPVQSLQKGEPWLQSLAPNSEGNQTCLLHNPRNTLTDQSWTDRDRKTHPFPPAHTEAGTAPGSVPQTMQKGNGPIPLGKAKEASFEISGVPKSWAHTPNPWRASLETWSQPHTMWHEYNVLRNSVYDWFRYRGLNFLVKSHWVHSQHAPITSRFVSFIYVFFKEKNKLRTPSVNPTLSVNIWFSNLNCKTLLEYLLGFIMCIYHLRFLDAECPQVYWEATGTQEIAAAIFWITFSEVFQAT